MLGTLVSKLRGTLVCEVLELWHYIEDFTMNRLLVLSVLDQNTMGLYRVVCPKPWLNFVCLVCQGSLTIHILFVEKQCQEE